MDTLEAVRSRRSIGRLAEPAPSREEIQVILDAAVAAPDHKELRPWRFFVIEGAAKDAFGEVCAEALRIREPEASPGKVDKELHKVDRAPLVIAVAAVHVPTALPFVELIGATAAAIQNMLLAATALGYGSIWRTGAAVRDPIVKRALGLESEDELLGLVYLGTTSAPTKPPSRTTDGVVEWWRPSRIPAQG
jgi:nitroreductase